jgi:hypothetical protein
MGHSSKSWRYSSKSSCVIEKHDAPLFQANELRTTLTDVKILTSDTRRGEQQWACLVSVCDRTSESKGLRLWSLFQRNSSLLRTITKAESEI